MRKEERERESGERERVVKDNHRETDGKKGPKKEKQKRKQEKKITFVV